LTYCSPLSSRYCGNDQQNDTSRTTTLLLPQQQPIDNLAAAATAEGEQQNVSGRTMAAVAVVFFFFGLWAQYQQYRHHLILANLRRRQHETSLSCGGDGGRSSSTTTKAAPCDDYRIPHGGWFMFVSCPHYFAEILIYLAFALLAELEKYDYWQQQQPSVGNATSPTAARHHGNNDHWYLLLWVATNLSVSSLESHAWYERHFHEEYKRLRRKAIVPLIL